ncbi:MAG: TOBE domain-containing protein [Rhizobiaceae bacterium]|nr:TOBE domain-containing protein [Rhizobiaceae bacterium]
MRFPGGDTSAILLGPSPLTSRRLYWCILGVRPEHVTVHDSAIDWQSVAAKVDLAEPMGSDSLMWLDIDGQMLSVIIKTENVRNKDQQCICPSNQVRRHCLIWNLKTDCKLREIVC